MARYYRESTDVTIERRIANADAPTGNPMVDNNTLRRDLVYGAVKPTSDQQKADAMAYLQRTGNTDVADMLGLTGTAPPTGRRYQGLTYVEVNGAVACPVCDQPAGRACITVQARDGKTPGGHRGKPHPDRIRAAKAAIEQEATA